MVHGIVTCPHAESALVQKISLDQAWNHGNGGANNNLLEHNTMSKISGSNASPKTLHAIYRSLMSSRSSFQYIVFSVTPTEHNPQRITSTGIHE